MKSNSEIEKEENVTKNPTQERKGFPSNKGNDNHYIWVKYILFIDFG